MGRSAFPSRPPSLLREESCSRRSCSAALGAKDGERGRSLRSSPQTPTLIVYGDQDVELGQLSLGNLRHLARHQVLVLQGAGHACYLDKPEEWHRGLLAFLQQLE